MLDTRVEGHDTSPEVNDLKRPGTGPGDDGWVFIGGDEGYDVHDNKASK